MLNGEAGGDRVEGLLESIGGGAEVRVYLSWVNWCEVFTRTQRDNPEANAEELISALAGVELVPFGPGAAQLAAGYAKVNRALSLGDRACLALAKVNSATAWTAHRIWAQFELDVPIKLIRP